MSPCTWSLTSNALSQTVSQFSPMRSILFNPFKLQLRSVHNFQSLDNSISKLLESKPDHDQVLDIISECKKIQLQIYQYNKLGKSHEIDQRITSVLSDEKVEFDKTLLGDVLKLNFPSHTNIDIINTFYKRHPNAHIDKPIAIIPFRQSLFDGNLVDALKLTDITVGHPNYLAFRHQELKSGVSKLIASAVGITLFSKFGVQELVDWGLLDEIWRKLSSVNSLILTYLFNSSFLMTIVKLGRQLVSAGGDYLTWQKGTFYSHWYKQADEMLFCTKIVEADIKLNGGGISGGEVSSELADELTRKGDNEMDMTPGYNRDGKKVRLLQLKDNFEDLKLQAYWMTGGDGFEWVEPDQDPAELIWENHLKKPDQLGKGEDKNQLKWAEQLIEQEK